MGSGIYCIENFINGKKYVGQTIDIDNRFKQHIQRSKMGYEDCIVLQKALKKYDISDFKFWIVELCSVEILDEREIFWIKELHSHITENGYNISWGGKSPMQGLKHSNKTKQKMSENSVGMTGKHHSDETKQKMSDAKRGKLRSDETKSKISKTKTGIRLSDDTRFNMSESKKGTHPSEETRQKMSQSAKNRWNRQLELKVSYEE